MKFLSTVGALRWQVWFWLVQLPPFIVAFVVLDTETFATMTLLYLGVVTILTAALGALSSLLAAEVAEKQKDDADVADVLAYLKLHLKAGSSERGREDQGSLGADGSPPS